MKNSSGRTITIFLIVLVIFASALAGIAAFYRQKEKMLRLKAESSLDELKNNESKVQAELKDARKKIFLLEEKNKEADERINDLMDNLELEQGLREEMKKENTTLREALEGENKSKEKMREDIMQDLTSSQERVKALETELSAEKARAKDLEGEAQSMQEKMKQMEVDFNSKLDDGATAPAEPAAENPGSPESPEATPEAPETPDVQNDDDQSKIIPKENKDSEIALDKIVVGSEKIPEARVLSVDKENEFLIFNLGQRHGINQGLILSVFRGDDYLGDIRVTRVQPEMSAADFIPPFSSQRVRKNDQVVVKNDSNS